MNKSEIWYEGAKSDNRGDIETFEDFLERNMSWWKINERFERVRRKPYYENFLKFGGVTSFINKNSVVAEVGPGPFGGMIEQMKLEVGTKVFVDYIMRYLHGLHFIIWPKTDVVYVNAPAERIPLDTNYCDILLSINCLDHGWNIWDAITECVRISRRCFLSFDCRGDSRYEVEIRQDGHDKDHAQLIKFDDVVRFMKDSKFGWWTLDDMGTKEFPVAYIQVCK